MTDQRSETFIAAEFNLSSEFSAMCWISNDAFSLERCCHEFRPTTLALIGEPVDHASTPIHYRAARLAP
jgi:hypothetical protein